MTTTEITTYTGTLTYHGLDLMLDVHEDGTHEIRCRPVLRDAWTTWSAPVTLTPESSEARA